MINIFSLFAQTNKINPESIGYNGVRDSGSAFLGILNTIYAWAGIIAVIVIIVAGYLFLTARGNPDQVKRGKDAIKGAVIGLIVVIFAFTITQFVLGRF